MTGQLSSHGNGCNVLFLKKNYCCSMSKNWIRERLESGFQLGENPQQMGNSRNQGI
jgi:hypothetical protein